MNVEGTPNLLEFAQEAGRIPRPHRDVHLSVVDCRLNGLSRSRNQQERAGRVREDENTPPSHDHVRLPKQAGAAEELGRYYARASQRLSVDATPHAAISAPCASGSHLGGDAAVGGRRSDYASEMITPLRARRARTRCKLCGRETRYSVHGMPDASRRC